MKGAISDVSATVVIGMNNTSALFECRKAVTLRCKAGASFANWQIAYHVETSTISSAQCFGTECYVQNNFTGRYKFTYSSETGISDLQIDPVIIEDDGREYKCNDGTQKPLRVTVKLFPTNSSFALKKATYENTHEVNFTLRLNCTADNVTITWYLTEENGIEVEVAATSTERHSCSDGECTSSNTSVEITSKLALEETSNSNTRRKRLAQGQTLGVNISYDLHKFHIPIDGSYMLKVNTTQSPSTVTVNIPTTSNVTTPSPSTATTPISTMNVSSSTDYRSDTSDNTYIILYSCVGSFIFLIIVISVVYCIVRQRRQGRKPPDNKYNMKRTNINVK